MQTNSTMLAVAAVVVGGMVYGAYQLGARQHAPQATITTTAPAVAPVAVAPATPPATPVATAPATPPAAPVATAPVTPPPPPVAQSAPPLPQVAALPPGAQLPAVHPPIPAPVPSLEQAATPEAKVNFTHFRVGNRNVKDMLVDGGYVWVATSGGVIRYDAKTEEYRLFDVRGGNLLANGVFHVGRMGKLIVAGTYGGGFSTYDPETDKWETYNIPNGLADPFVYDTLTTRDGDIWIATWSGANRIKGGKLKDRSQWETFTVENTAGGLPNDWVYGLAEGKNGEIWVATEGGLGRYLDGKWQHWTHADGLGVPYEQVKAQNPFQNDPAQVSSHHARQKEEQGLSGVSTAYNPNYVISMAVDHDGNVWCGTWGAGLAKFDGVKWTNYAMAEGLPSNYLFMLQVDGKGRIWAGTSNGLARMEENGSFKVMTTSDGLFSNNVFSMALTDEGNLWVGSFGGVARIKVD